MHSHTFQHSVCWDSTQTCTYRMPGSTLIDSQRTVKTSSRLVVEPTHSVCSLHAASLTTHFQKIIHCKQVSFTGKKGKTCHFSCKWLNPTFFSVFLTKSSWNLCDNDCLLYMYCMFAGPQTAACSKTWNVQSNIHPSLNHWLKCMDDSINTTQLGILGTAPSFLLWPVLMPTSDYRIFLSFEMVSVSDCVIYRVRNTYMRDMADYTLKTN